MKSIVILLLFISGSMGLVPPRFQWKVIDFSWSRPSDKEMALAHGDYIPAHNMPTGLARWKDKLFITIPRWKRGVPSSLNYVNLDGKQSQPLRPYPDWATAFVRDSNPRVSSNATVVSTFRIHVDRCDRLWVVDNGVTDMASGAKQVADPAVIVFDLNTDEVIRRYPLPDEVLRDTSVFTSIVVDNIEAKGCDCCQNTFAYITDMGSNAIVVYDWKEQSAWRIEHRKFTFDPDAAVYKVGGIDFYWNDGVSSATLAKPAKDGYRDLLFHPTSSTKLFKMSTALLRDQDASKAEISYGIEVVGDRGPRSQATACDFDPKTNVLFFTQVSKNGFGCWNLDKPFNQFTPVVMSDCSLLEFPNDIKVDQEGDIWILSDRQSRFLYDRMDFNQVNFRILTAPISLVIQGTPCGKGKKSFCKGLAKKSSSSVK